MKRAEGDRGESLASQARPGQVRKFIVSAQPSNWPNQSLRQIMAVTSRSTRSQVGPP